MPNVITTVDKNMNRSHLGFRGGGSILFYTESSLRKTYKKMELALE